MKLRLLAMVVLLFSPATAAHCARRHCRTLSANCPTLSATTKKPASLAGFLYLTLTLTRLTALFLPAARASHTPRSLLLIMQTPSSL
jgi:hypothetical protein